MTLLNDACVTLNLENFKYFTEMIDYLGHVIHPIRLAVASHRTDAMCGLQPPKNLTKLRLFLNLCDKFRRFFLNFARVAIRLNRKLCREQPSTLGTLTGKEMNSLKILRDALISPTFLALPNSTCHMTLDSDACEVQVK